MTDTHDDGTEREDRVLVRPYVTTEPKEPLPPEEQDTALLPTVPPEDSTREQPTVAPPSRPRFGSLSVPKRLLVLIGGVALALGVGAYLIFGGGPIEPHRGVVLPRPAGGATPPDVQAVGPAAQISASLSASPSASVSLPTPSPSASAGVSTAPSAPSTPVTSAVPSLTPPAADRTGAITAASGRCLAIGSLLGMDGSPVTVSGCANVAYQRFTLASDGTLRANNRCAQPTGDGSVKLTGCDAAPQWRAGPNGTIVEPGSSRCLTDPGRAGASTTVAACEGGDSQRWTLP